MVNHRDHLTIGRFAGLTGISAYALRRYDAMGLLTPALTDPDSGYRFYAIEQLDTGVLIRLLRDLDVPLSEIKTLVSAAEPDHVRSVLTHHRRRITDRLTELEGVLAHLDLALDDERGLLPYQVETVVLQPTWVVSRAAVTTRPLLDPTIERCLAELHGELNAAGDAPAGRELILYHNPLNWYREFDMQVCLPIPRAAAEAHGGWQLPGGRAMRTVYRGPWDNIWQAYAALLARIARGGYEVCGPVREFYLVDERETDDPARYLTEITWPVQPRMAAPDELGPG